MYDPAFQAAWHLEEDKKLHIIEKCKQVMNPGDFNNVESHLLQERNETMYEQFLQFNNTLG